VVVDNDRVEAADRLILVAIRMHTADPPIGLVRHMRRHS
jgi:hypothetical protein